MISQACAALPVGVAPQSADAAAKPIVPTMTMRRWPTTSPILPPSANNAARASRYPLITHCSPVDDKARSRWMVGAAIETIVWSIDIIATAKIIALRTR